MTGGSRNILDLSKKSLVESGNPTGTPFYLGEAGFMRGGVEFFGLNPTATDQTANITINFEGQDYLENTILYPEGNNANGTWRLQIKGKIHLVRKSQMRLERKEGLTIWCGKLSHLRKSRTTITTYQYSLTLTLRNSRKLQIS